MSLIKAFRSPKAYIYKLRLQTGNKGNLFSGDLDREEYARITVEGDQVRIVHATSVMDKFWGTRNWFDHKPTVIRTCPANSFDEKSCLVIEGDSFTMAADKVIKDYAIDFKFIESGELRSRSIQIEQERQPDEIQ